MNTAWHDTALANIYKPRLMEREAHPVAPVRDVPAATGPADDRKDARKKELRKLHETMCRAWDDLGSNAGSAGALAEYELRSDLFWEAIDALIVSRPEIICLCGSSRFIEHFAILSWEFEKLGNIVLGLHYLPPSYPGLVSDHQAEAEGIADKMDALHLRKIDMADRVFVINIGGYIGDSTRREIEYARSQNKPVAFLSPVI